MKASTILLTWLTCSIALGVIGLIVGMQQTMPGPSSRAALMSHPGELAALNHKIPATDGFLIYVTRTDKAGSLESARPAVEELTTRLQNVRSATSGQRLFSIVHSPFSNLAPK